MLLLCTLLKVQQWPPLIWTRMLSTYYHSTHSRHRTNAPYCCEVVRMLSCEWSCEYYVYSNKQNSLLMHQYVVFINFQYLFHKKMLIIDETSINNIRVKHCTQETPKIPQPQYQHSHKSIHAYLKVPTMTQIQNMILIFTIERPQGNLNDNELVSTTF
jgi:hypothetical protein